MMQPTSAAAPLTMQDTPRIRTIPAMERAIGNGHWDDAAVFFTPDVRYHVGRLDPRIGVQGIREHMEGQNGKVRWTGHTPRLAVEIDDTVVTEVDSHFERVSDGARIVLPCADIYRFTGDRIHEWRVYSDVQAIGL